MHRTTQLVPSAGGLSGASLSRTLSLNASRGLRANREDQGKSKGKARQCRVHPDLLRFVYGLPRVASEGELIQFHLMKHC